MKTFSSMSIPDLALTRESYQFMFELVNACIEHHKHSASELLELRQKANRVLELIAAIDHQISTYTLYN